MIEPDATGPDEPVSPWADPEPEPTDLLVLWPGPDLPLRDEVVRALARCEEGAPADVTDIVAEDPSVAWCAAVETPGALRPLVLWAEPARTPAAADPPDVRSSRARWAVGVEVMLDVQDPLAVYCRLLRTVAGGVPAAPAVLDVNSTRWHTRAELDEMLVSDAIEPPAQIMWLTHVVEGPSGTWLHTHGLRRCGRPELEMLGVPRADAAPAAELIDALASLLLEGPPPSPGVPVEIGPELAVTLQPWWSVVPHIDRAAPGGPADRAGDAGAAHTGNRAVICAVGGDEDGSRWRWPEAVVRRLQDDEATYYCTARATQRQTLLARAGWDVFAAAITAAAAREPARGVRFGVEAALAVGPDASFHEHLWFEVCRVEQDRFEGRLVHRPRDVADLGEGDRTWIDLESVTDWRVFTRDGSHGPDDLAALKEITAAWRARGEGSA